MFIVIVTDAHEFTIDYVGPFATEEAAQAYIDGPLRETGYTGTPYLLTTHERID